MNREFRVKQQEKLPLWWWALMFFPAVPGALMGKSNLWVLPVLGVSWFFWVMKLNPVLLKISDGGIGFRTLWLGRFQSICWEDVQYANWIGVDNASLVCRDGKAIDVLYGGFEEETRDEIAKLIGQYVHVARPASGLSFVAAS